MCLCGTLITTIQNKLTFYWVTAFCFQIVGKKDCRCILLFAELATMVEKKVQNLTVNFGPQHPAAHGVLRLVLTLNGEVSMPLVVSGANE